MKDQRWIFSLRYFRPSDQDVKRLERYAIVGPARASTVEAVFRLARVPEVARAHLATLPIVRLFVEDLLDFSRTGYYEPGHDPSVGEWLICIGPVHEVLS